MCVLNFVKLGPCNQRMPSKSLSQTTKRSKVGPLVITFNSSPLAPKEKTTIEKSNQERSQLRKREKHKNEVALIGCTRSLGKIYMKLYLG